MIDGVVLKAQLIQVEPPNCLINQLRTLMIVPMIFGRSTEGKLKDKTKSGSKS